MLLVGNLQAPGALKFYEQLGRKIKGNELYDIYVDKSSKKSTAHPILKILPPEYNALQNDHKR